MKCYITSFCVVSTFFYVSADKKLVDFSLVWYNAEVVDQNSLIAIYLTSHRVRIWHKAVL